MVFAVLNAHRADCDNSRGGSEPRDVFAIAGYARGFRASPALARAAIRNAEELAWIISARR
jgi:hypothetical protein